MRLVSIILTAAIIGIASIAGSAPAGAASSIRVKVDDQPITSYDIAQRAKLLQMTGVKGGEKAATDELINETLQFIEAAKKGITISDARVDDAIAQIALRVKMTPDALTKALSQQGVDIATLRRRIKAQMVWGRLLEVRAQTQGATVKGADITTTMFAEKGSTDIKTTEYTVRPIIFVVPKNASAALDNQRRREAEAYRSRFVGCDGAVEQAKQLNGVVVRPVARRTVDQLEGAPEAQDIRETPAGKLTRPRKTEDGYTMIAVCTAKSIQSNADARVQAESKLLGEANKNLGADYLAELRKKAVIEYR